jgi:hypothetical protein
VISSTSTSGRRPFLLQLDQVGGLAGVPVPAGEAVIGLALYRWAAPYERSSAMLNVDQAFGP